MYLGKLPSPVPCLKVSLIRASNEMSPSARSRPPLLFPHAGRFYRSLTIIFFVPPVPSLWASTQNNSCTWPCVLITSGMRRKLCGLRTWRQRGKWLIQAGQEEGQGPGVRRNQRWNGIVGKAPTVRVKLAVLAALFLWDISRERTVPPSSKQNPLCLEVTAHQGLPGTESAAPPSLLT